METYITVSLKVFDDDEYCSGEFSYCERISFDECSLFLCDGMPTELEKDEIPIKNGTKITHIKCDECKEHWQRADETRPSKCKSCGKEIQFTGKYWEHIGSKPRHPAIPDKPLPEGHRLG